MEKFPRDLSPQAHVWRDQVLLCVITMPKDVVRCDGCEESFVAAGFPPPLRLAGETHRKGEETMHQTITRAHKLVLQDFVRMGFHERWHLLILEDDARLQYRSPEMKLRRALRKLDQWKNWTCLHVGHVPLGPCLPLGWNLCRSTMPYAAHAILYNRSRLPNINPKNRWGRPWFFEGMMAVPLDERFAMMPSICGQSVTPKEMQSIPLIKHMSYQRGEMIMTVLAVVEACLVLIMASYGGVCIAKGLTNRKSSLPNNKWGTRPLNAPSVVSPKITTGTTAMRPVTVAGCTR